MEEGDAQLSSLAKKHIFQTFNTQLRSNHPSAENEEVLTKSSASSEELIEALERPQASAEKFSNVFFFSLKDLDEGELASISMSIPN